MSKGTSAAGPALVVENLRKNFRSGFLRRKKTILRGVEFEVRRGEIFGFIGTNGAGKTTTIKCLLRILIPDEGRIQILGRDGSDPSAKAGVGFLPENPYFYDHLTGYEFLDFYGRLFGLDRTTRARRVEELLKTVAMEKHARVTLRKYSRGMLQRIGVAQALINDPELVILDEPLSGLDPLGRRALRDVILDLKNRGRTVFFTSHILSDAEALCNRVAILSAGRVKAVGDVEKVAGVGVLGYEISCRGLSPEKLNELGTVSGTHGAKLMLRVPDEKSLGEALRAIEGASGVVDSISSVRRSLEDFLLEILGPDAGESTGG